MSKVFTFSLFWLTAAVVAGLVFSQVSWSQQPPIPFPPKCEHRTPISKLPFKIDKCGSYFLTDCLTGRSGDNGIEINASDVTLNLNGFSLMGVSGSRTGIVLETGVVNVTIMNGSVRDWPLDGIVAVGARGCVFHHLRLSNNGEFGLRAGEGCIIADCTVTENGLGGISAVSASGSTIRDCTVLGNQDVGIDIDVGNIVAGCVVDGRNSTTTSVTAHGIRMKSANLVTHCATFSMTMPGGRHIEAVGSGSQGNVIVNNVCNGSGSGVYVSSAWNRIEGNHVANAAIGFDVLDFPGSPNTIFKNSASGNSTANYNIGASNDSGPICPARTATSPWTNIEF